MLWVARSLAELGFPFWGAQAQSHRERGTRVCVCDFAHSGQAQEGMGVGGLVENKDSSAHGRGDRESPPVAGVTALSTATLRLPEGWGSAAPAPPLSLTPPLLTASAKGGRCTHL